MRAVVALTIVAAGCVSAGPQTGPPDEPGWTGSTLAGDAFAKVVGEAPGDHAGISVSFATDMNVDGVPDVLIGAPGHGQAGAAYLVSGVQLSGTTSLTQAMAKFTGEHAGDRAGQAVRTALDNDGDGVGDVLVSAPGFRDGAGAVYLLSGPLTGEHPLGSLGTRITGDAPGDGFGSTLSMLGDTDHDARNDFVAGAPGALGGRGQATIWRGGNTRTQASAADVVVEGTHPGDALGAAVGSPGDIDADGFDDTFFGAPGSDRGGDDAGAAYVVFTPGAGLLAAQDADVVLTGVIPGERVGSFVDWIGDANADGYCDAMVAGSDVSSAIYVLYGPLAGDQLLDTADIRVIAGEGGSEGYALNGPGDVDGDDYAEVVLSAPLDGAHGERAGALYVFHGPIGATVTLDDADFHTVGEHAGDEAGWSLSWVPDHDGDGFFDVLLGAHLNDEGGEDAGAAYLLAGGPVMWE